MEHGDTLADDNTTGNTRKAMMELFRCQQCVNYASTPIYRCTNDHVKCNLCHSQTGSTCNIADCRKRLNESRGETLVRMAKNCGLRFPCRYPNCNEAQLLLENKRSHEDVCPFQ